MSLIHVDSAVNPNQFQIKVGDASSYFEKRRLWEEGLGGLVFKACIAVCKAHAKKKQHLGDLLYCALVHSIDQIVATVVRQNGAFRTDKDIDLRFPMKDTGAWKPDAQLKDVVGVAAWILQPYTGVDLSEPQLILKIFEDFEIIWLEVISPMFDKQTGLLDRFEGGGCLDNKLLGEDLHQKLTEIRTNLKKARGQNVAGTGVGRGARTKDGQSEASASTAV